MTTYKKTLAFVATGILACSIQAANMDQWHSMFNLNDTNKGGTYVEMKGSAEVSLYLQSGMPNGAVEFGYVVFNESTGNQGGATPAALVPLTFNDAGYATIGGFNDGDTIAFWTRNADGSISYSAEIAGGDGSYDKNFFDRVKQNEVFVPNYDHKINQLTMTSAGTTFSFSVVLNQGGSGNSPSGQPLPGLIATAGVGLAAAAAAVRKRRNGKKTQAPE